MTRNIQHFFELLWSMTDKELRARYKYTIFGFLWLVANPLLQMLVIGFVFTFFIKEPIEHYYYYLFTGLLIWNFFSLSLTKCAPSIVNERSLIKKAVFPHMVIPLSIILSNFINFFVALVLLLIPIAFLGKMSFNKLPYIVSAIVLLCIFTAGISILTSALDVKYRDVNFFIQALLIPWFYATPIVYSLSQIPRGMLWIWRLNPLTSILQLAQYALLGAPAPGLGMLASNIVVIIVITVLGFFLFRKESKTFDDWL